MNIARNTNDKKRLRERMVKDQIAARGVADPRVLAAMTAVPRHLFVQEALASQAYEDHPLPIGHNQTISQPYIVALMTEMVCEGLAPGDFEKDPPTCLEIGTGSGYQAAVLAEVGFEVYTVERIRDLYAAARDRFTRMRYFSVKTKLDDGTTGWPEKGPFDRILVTAGGPKVPEDLVAQMADPGLLVIPVGGSKRMQQLVVVRKEGGEVSEERRESVSFVDLIGKHGW